MTEKKLVLSTENLSFSYRSSEPIIKNVSLKVEKGSVYGFLGPNGAGKTTTIRLIMGLLQPQSGDIKLFNDEDKNLLETYSRIGAMIEDPALYYHLTAKENLEITANYRNINKNRIGEVLEIVSLSNTGNKKVKEFSTGMKQRLGIASALLSDPELIILDEPTNGLDPKGMLEVRKLIKRLSEEENKTIFLSSHLLNEIEKVCTHVGIIQNGSIKFQGTVDELRFKQDDNLIVEFETDNSEKLNEILIRAKVDIIERNNGTIKVSLENREQIPELIDKSRSESIKLYQVKISKENLEDLFLSLTEE